jgi:hypothetical protein
MTVYQLIASDKPAAPKRAPRPHRFCAECAHHVETRVMFVVPDHLCGHPVVAHPVTRQPLIRCDDMRHAKGKCGERAKLFELAPRLAPSASLLTPARIRELFTRHMGRVVA